MRDVRIYPQDKRGHVEGLSPKPVGWTVVAPNANVLPLVLPYTGTGTNTQAQTATERVTQFTLEGIDTSVDQASFEDFVLEILTPTSPDVRQKRRIRANTLANPSVASLDLIESSAGFNPALPASGNVTYRIYPLLMNPITVEFNRQASGTLSFYRGSVAGNFSRLGEPMQPGEVRVFRIQDPSLLFYQFSTATGANQTFSWTEGDLASKKSSAPFALYLDFWSTPEPTVVFTTTPGTKSITNTITVALPAGAVIDLVRLMIKFRQVEDTSGLVNAINGATCNVQVDDSGGTGWLTGYTIPDNTLRVAGNVVTRSPGDIFIGTTDISSRVDGDDTYSCQIVNAASDGNNLTLRDFEWGVRIYYHS